MTARAGFKAGPSGRELAVVAKTARQMDELRRRGYSPVSTEGIARVLGLPLEVDPSSASYRISTAGTKNVLDAFDLPCVIVNWPGRREIWTSKTSMKVIDDIASVAILLVHISIPEVARRLAKRRDVFDEFDAARRLGADEDTLLEVLKPIKRGRDQ
jgi:hypothetical protein